MNQKPFVSGTIVSGKVQQIISSLITCRNILNIVSKGALEDLRTVKYPVKPAHVHKTRVGNSFAKQGHIRQQLPLFLNAKVI